MMSANRKTGQTILIIFGGARLCLAPSGISRSNLAMAVGVKSPDASGKDNPLRLVVPTQPRSAGGIEADVAASRTRLAEASEGGRAPQTEPEHSRWRLSPESRYAARNYFTFSVTSISTCRRPNRKLNKLFNYFQAMLLGNINQQSYYLVVFEKEMEMLFWLAVIAESFYSI